MNSGSILIKEAGQAIPKALFEKLLASTGTFFGAAHIQDGEFVVISAGPGEVNADQLDTYQTNLLGDKVWMYFGKSDNALTPESCQPFFLLQDKDGKDDVIAMLEGDFEQFAEPASSHSPAFFFMQKQVKPHLSSYIRITESAPKLFEMLKDPIHMKNYCNMWGNRGAMVLINRAGENLIWEKNNEKLHEMSEWGYLSNTFAPVAAAAPVASVPAFGTRRTAPTGTESKVPAQDPPGVHRTGNTTVITHPPESKPVMETIERDEKPPKEFWGNRDKVKQWYRLTIPKSKELPIGWDSKTDPPAIKVRMQVSKEAHTAMLASTAAVPPKDTTVSQDVAEKALPIPAVLPVKQIEDVKNNFFKDAVIAKIIDENAVQITSPRELQAIERKHLTFCESFNLTGLEATFKWPFEKRVEFASRYPRASALLELDLTYALADALTKLEELGHKAPAPAPRVETPKPAATTTNAIGTARKRTAGM